MSDHQVDFAGSYARALAAHLASPSETSLNAAYELGRQVIASGRGILELASLHHLALRRLAADGPPERIESWLERASAFCIESLSAFEMSLRGFQEANKRLLTLNKELKQAQTAMEAANRELESFSYSVAHDLRAPLRSIDGFSQALLDDYADRLDEEGRQHLRDVRESAQEMAALIDGLLTLSQVTRGKLKLEDVDLSRAAAAVLAKLQSGSARRKAAVSVAERLNCRADPRLLKVALTNLLGNAWKFTRQQPEVRIEFGMQELDGEAVYFVRDNGAGFDMAYAGKLFGVFQRLHSAAEFEGTGIGLATVQRIIARHGGRIWAEGVVGRGATFYFTLSKPPLPGDKSLQP